MSKAPEKLGDVVGGAIGKIIRRRRSGEVITREDEIALEKAIDATPTAVSAILGDAVAVLIDDTVSKEGDSESILAGYSFICDLICVAMSSRKTSLALSGFLHDNQCISYWHLSGATPRFESNGGTLKPRDLSVYLLYDRPADDVVKLNNIIRYDRNRQLEEKVFDYHHDKNVALVERIEDVRVAIRKLDPNDPLANSGLGFPNTPKGSDLPIAQGPEPMVAMWESLSVAVAIHDAPGAAVRGAIKRLPTENYGLSRSREMAAAAAAA
jgi:hypothetical protein